METKKIFSRINRSWLRRSKIGISIIHAVLEKNNIILRLNGEGKKIFQKPQLRTNEDLLWIRNHDPKLLTTVWPLLTTIAFEPINCFKSFNWFNYFAGPHIRHVETFLPIGGTFCNLFLFTARLCSFIGIIFHEIQTPKLKASLTSIDIILATISSCQGIKMYSIHLLLLQKGTYFNYWSEAHLV